MTNICPFAVYPTAIQRWGGGGGGGQFSGNLKSQIPNRSAKKFIKIYLLTTCRTVGKTLNVLCYMCNILDMKGMKFPGTVVLRSLYIT